MQYAVVFTIVVLCSAASMGLVHYLWRKYYTRQMNWQRNRTQRECAESHEKQLDMLGEQSRQYYQMKEDVDKIAMCLREQYQPEITQGFHGGRGLGEVVVGYLMREREQTRRMKDASQQRSAEAAKTTDFLNKGRN